MLFFLDESWQESQKKKGKVGVLAAIHLDSNIFNEASSFVHKQKVKYWGRESGNSEIKGTNIFKKRNFEMESREGIKSHGLDLARSILKYVESLDTKFFASIVLRKELINLTCADENRLERPFFFLFERIQLFMEENYDKNMAKLIFDDRGIQDNKKISRSVSNFFNKSTKGREFCNIMNVPFFAISNENIGIQIADMLSYILGKNKVDPKSLGLKEFYEKIKKLEFRSSKHININGKKSYLRGFKVLKEKETGISFNPIRIK